MFTRCHAARSAPRRPPLRRQALLVVAVLASATACGSRDVERDITLAEAQATAVGQIRDATAAVFPSGFTLRPLTALPLNCTDFNDQPTGRVQVGVTFWIDDVPASRNDAYFDALADWWARHGWTSTTDSRPDDMFANATSDDGYLMSLQASIDARLAIGVTTPCVPGDGPPARRRPPAPMPPASPQSIATTSEPTVIPPASRPERGRPAARTGEPRTA